MGRIRRGTGHIYQRGKIRWVKYYRNGEPFFESSQSERAEDAERLLKRRQGEIVTGRFAGLGPERVRMAELFSDVIQDDEVHKRFSVDDAKSRVRLHLEPAFGKKRA